MMHKGWLITLLLVVVIILGVLGAGMIWYQYSTFNASAAKASPVCKDQRLTRIFQQMNNNLEHIRTAEGEFTEVSQVDKASKAYQHFNNKRSHYRWAIAGNRFMEERHDISSDGSLKNQELYTYNGITGHYWFSNERQGGESREVGSSVIDSLVSDIFRLNTRYFRGATTYADDIYAHHPVLAGEETVSDLRCYRIDGSDKDHAKYSWWVCPERGYQVVMEKLQTKKYCRVLRMGGFIRSSDGYWLPSEIVFSASETKPDGKMHEVYRFSFKAQRLVLNKPVSFWRFNFRDPEQGSEARVGWC